MNEQVLHAKVWEYKGYLLCSAVTQVSIPEETIRPSTSRQALGCVTFQTEKFLGVSAEAIELMRTIKPGPDDISNIDWFVTNDGQSVFAWLGGLNVVIDPQTAEGAKNYAVRDGMFVPILNEPPQEAKDYVDALITAATPLWSSDVKENKE